MMQLRPRNESCLRSHGFPRSRWLGRTRSVCLICMWVKDVRTPTTNVKPTCTSARSSDFEHRVGFVGWAIGRDIDDSHCHYLRGRIPQERLVASRRRRIQPSGLTSLGRVMLYPLHQWTWSNGSRSAAL